MASVNKVLIIGRLGRDPDMRYSPDGAAICNLSVATTLQWTDKASGERREDTEWHRVTLYHRLAEIAGEYLRKGREVYIEGRLKTRKWQDKDTGADRYSTDIIADQMQMLGARDANGQDAHAPAQQAAGEPEPAGRSPRSARRAAPKAAGRAAPQAASQPSAALAEMADDIPF